MKTQLTVLSSYIVSKCQYDWLANMGRSAYIVSVDGVCGHVVCVCVCLQLRVTHDDDNVTFSCQLQFADVTAKSRCSTAVSLCLSISVCRSVCLSMCQ